MLVLRLLLTFLLVLCCMVITAVRSSASNDTGGGVSMDDTETGAPDRIVEGETIGYRLPVEASGSTILEIWSSLSPAGTAELDGRSLPSTWLPWLGHLQGVVSLRPVSAEPLLVVSSSIESDLHGYLATFRHGQPFEMIELHPSDLHTHLGGCQSMGRFLAVGAEKNGRSTVLFYELRSGRLVPLSYRLERNGGSAGAVGIAHLSDGKGGRYYLSVCCDGDNVDFYRSKPGIVIGHPDFSFGGYDKNGEWIDGKVWKRWNGRKCTRNIRSSLGWAPDLASGNYVNSCSLVSDDGGRLYFVGLHTQFEICGPDWADLYLVNTSDDLPGSKLLTKLAHFSADCTGGAHFRWGASVCVLKDGRLEIAAIERNVSDGISLNFFRTRGPEGISISRKINNELLFFQSFRHGVSSQHEKPQRRYQKGSRDFY